MAKLSESLRAMAAIERGHYERDQKWQAKTVAIAADRYTLQTPNQLSVEMIDIYLASGTGASTTSVNGGTISDTRTWMDFVDDGYAVKKRLLDDAEFQMIATGSNEETNITGSADPVTTSGHVNTASRRMISNIGCEDCTGAMWQWLKDQSYRYDGGAHTHVFTGAALATHTHNITVPGGAAAAGTDALSIKAAVLNKESAGADTVVDAVVAKTAGTPAGSNASVDPAPAVAWYALPGSKGRLYRQGTYGDCKLLAGGPWTDGVFCGSRSRHATDYRWLTSAAIGGRFLTDPGNTKIN